MINRITLITLGVKDIQKSKEFYVGLGFEIKKERPTMIDFKIDGTDFSIFPIDMLAKDINPDNPPEIINGFSGTTLAHNPSNKEDVDTIYQRVIELGGTPITTPRKAIYWDGYHFYFKDLDGHYWEIAH
ncbi:MAG: VOC family protein [Oscillospiraceae bacterium]|nr:VOC family protein [Oscillospiraceae bacterium]